MNEVKFIWKYVKGIVSKKGLGIVGICICI